MAQVDSLKQKADRAYIQEDYIEAIDAYESILQQEYVSAEVHYNLGNAYFKSGQIAPSILNYERGKKLAPRDEDIVFNLKLANLSVKDRVEEMPKLFIVNWWHTILHTFGTDGWAWSAVIAIFFGLVGLLLFKFSNEEGMKRLTFYLAIVCLGWGVFSIYAAQRSFNHAVNDKRAVVFTATLNVKSAPDRKGKDLFVIHEGLVVTVTDELNGWVRIKLTNGNVGWIPATGLETI
ncbi:MAG: SH3 domain-containing protein [Flavobacteriales bacterium]|nr:SH3 domain-containing protein [Flavobacteriales bacterium]